MPREDSKHATVRLKDETCGPGKEFRVHIFFSHETAFPKLECGYILRLHRLKVNAYYIVFLHFAFKDHTLNRCMPNTSSYNTKNQIVQCTNWKLNHFLSVSRKKWHISRLKGSDTTWVAAVPKWKVTKLFQATEMQTGICELHHSNSEGKLRS